MKIVFALMMSLTACSAVTERALYEGMRQQQQIRREPSPSDNQRLPDYDRYKQERDKLKPSLE